MRRGPKRSGQGRSKAPAYQREPKLQRSKVRDRRPQTPSQSPGRGNKNRPEIRQRLFLGHPEQEGDGRARGQHRFDGGGGFHHREGFTRGAASAGTRVARATTEYRADRKS